MGYKEGEGGGGGGMRETNCCGSVAIRRVSNAPYVSECFIRFELIDGS